MTWELRWHPFRVEWVTRSTFFPAAREGGGGSMTNESDPDEKAAELRAALD